MTDLANLSPTELEYFRHFHNVHQRILHAEGSPEYVQSESSEPSTVVTADSDKTEEGKVASNYYVRGALDLAGRPSTTLRGFEHHFYAFVAKVHTTMNRLLYVNDPVNEGRDAEQ
jgi:hypothetical protein